MLEEVAAGLLLSKKKIVVDGTLGLGGHAAKVLQLMAAEGKLLGFDLDSENLAIAKKNLRKWAEHIVFIQNNFSALDQELKKLKIKSIDALLLDLGLSSAHVDNPEKGFSFLKEGPLDMRYDKSQSLTAAEVINKYSQKELARIFFEYGEEPFAKKIAAKIAGRRRWRPFKTTTELADFIEKLLKRKGHLHPATRVFQAIRIEVNHELDALNSVLNQAVTLMKKGGRIAVIAYHSLEDRLVKQFFLMQSRKFINLPHELKTTMLEPKLKIVTKKPLVPTETEVQANPRSRSAKLRIAERI